MKTIKVKYPTFKGNFTDSVLKNRNMIGEFPLFKKGKNTITLSGAVTELTVIANSRWL
jgi:phage-related protein